MTTDLRLAPAALAAWGTAWALTGGEVGDAPSAGVLRAAVAGVAVVGVALLAGASGQRRSHTVRSVGTHAFLVLAVAASTALSVQAAVAGSAPLAALADDRGHAVLEGRVVSEARASAFGGGATWTLAVDTVFARAVASGAGARAEVTVPGPAPPYGSRVVVDAALAPARPGTAVAARAVADVAEVVRAPPAVVRATNTARTALLEVCLLYTSPSPRDA